MADSSRRAHRWSVPLWALLAVSAVVALVVPAPVALAQDAPLPVVNLGDSYSAGSGIIPPNPFAPPPAGSPRRCLQSGQNWAHDLASARGYQLTDVSCAGAETKDLAVAQMPEAGPQLAALSSTTRLVTLTLGGNDADVFLGSLTKCGRAGLLSAGRGSPCAQAFGSSFVDTIRASTYPHLVAALASIRAKAPRAQVAISSYLQVLPAEHGCFPAMPIAEGDVGYLHGVQATLNDAVRRAADATGAVFVDQTPSSSGHDACSPAPQRWVEPVFGAHTFLPVHPNAAGEHAMADRAAAVLDARNGAPVSMALTVG